MTLEELPVCVTAREGVIEIFDTSSELMGRIRNFLNRIFGRKQRKTTADVDKIRVEFRERYQHFRLLVKANNTALEVMADIEHGLTGRWPFGMAFVKASCTAVSDHVLSMITNMEKLAPEKYNELFPRFDDIHQNIEELLAQQLPVEYKRLVIPLTSVYKDMADLVGSKMANLGELKNKMRLNVPEGFVITSAAYQRFIEHNNLQPKINRYFASVDTADMKNLYDLASEIERLIYQSDVPKDLIDGVVDAWSELKKKVGEEVTVAMRSSALGEDTAESSFAGQYRSVLNVSFESVFQAYKVVLASKYSLRAIVYRLDKGLRDEDISMCVGCLVMADAVAGGVTYSSNPIDIRDDSVFINAVWGLPKAVVDGSIDCDLFVVSKQVPMKVIHEEIKDKGKEFVCLPKEGVCRLDVTQEKRGLPAIDHNQAVRLAEIAIRLEAYYGSPQDIEWAIGHDGSICILQCRPLRRIETTKKDYPPVKTSDKAKVIAKGRITASPGAACGTVHIVDQKIDILQFPKGAVLVARQALPRWASLLDRASAVVAEHGGFAGHLANVAREFGVPALFGVQGAVNKLNNGDLVTVDADNLTIYKGKTAISWKKSKTQPKLMEGNPAYDLLKQVSGHIIPLHLLDPDSSSFTPSNCKTFHDITRFIHEKAVSEIFRFGNKHSSLVGASKQLYYKAPMRWWVVNLDDGFRKEVDGKYVKLEDIVSIPMLAFWEGFVAVPWEGPPGIDAKGLMSVVFRSTVTPGLVSGTRSEFANPNYFVISKNYCNLSSRMGYHFATLEALVGEQANENYISFQFKGGAADYSRRIKRVLLIGDILKEHGFSVETREDNMIARLVGREEDYMKQRLMILGYLHLHTRQIDVIMANPAAVRYYTEKYRKDIDSLGKD